jgi:hypothetical protein
MSLDQRQTGQDRSRKVDKSLARESHQEKGLPPCCFPSKTAHLCTLSLSGELCCPLPVSPPRPFTFVKRA